MSNYSYNLNLEELIIAARKDAIENHRKLWNYISEETKKQQRCITKEEAFKHFGWPLTVHSYCWCCEYAYFIYSLQKDRKHHIHCVYCPIEWGDYEALEHHKECTDKTDFNVWAYAVERNNWLTAYKYAKRIAELPERKD